MLEAIIKLGLGVAMLGAVLLLGQVVVGICWNVTCPALLKVGGCLLVGGFMVEVVGATLDMVFD